MIATIYKSTGSFYLAYDASGRKWNCRVRGKLKIDTDISSTNPIAVGDIVALTVENEGEDSAIIMDIKQRNNYMVRTSPHNKHQKHIVAANIDLALLVATMAEPRTSNGFIDRFLITAEAYHIPAIIVFNKSDLLEGKSMEEYENRKAIYEKIGYKTFLAAAEKGLGLDALADMLKDKTTLFSGHSGVGKSTLINYFIPNQNLRVQEVSGWSGKGQHTTTFAEMFDLPQGGRIIDTPGVKEFGIVDMEREELSHYFPEMKVLINDCKFNNCIHINEPGCAVKAAVAAGEVSMERFESYIAILSSL
ncbi:ribosome small subunit-dependent GTPase A [Taibaiella lutea]|uniref:Small ribosomal subunit biogenesis GTPase RsgA n=1 Tax=Taibaiella lutea TaxID=2608001 RepID=A0A5M6CQU7_9BACT|nr:ribosome small subunit-dependent GTPase A [Taibaiella lutea]KAA5537336.1 ribosome small subunit-dependent GTPase A [Taibaiella lutea]